MVSFSSHNMQLQAEETIVTAQWVKSLPSNWKGGLEIQHIFSPQCLFQIN